MVVTMGRTYLAMRSNGWFIRAAIQREHMEITARHHLRSDEVDALRERIAEDFGVSLGDGTFEAVEFADSDRRIVLVDGEPTILRTDEGPVLTVRGANQVDPDRRIVVVDAGAIPFVSDGADVMRPGIVEGGSEIAPGDPVLIAEETHGKILAIGRSQVDGDELTGEQGKVIASIHHVGDDLYEFSG